MLSQMQNVSVESLSKRLKGTWDSATGRQSSASSVTSARHPRKTLRWRTAEEMPDSALVGGERRMERSAGSACLESCR